MSAQILVVEPAPAVRRGWVRWLLENGIEALSAADLAGAPVLVPGRDPLVLVCPASVLAGAPDAYQRRVLDRATLILLAEPDAPPVLELAGLRVAAQLPRSEAPPPAALVAVTRARERAGEGRPKPPRERATVADAQPVTAARITRELFERARRLAGLSTPALIVGEEGSGRRTLARRLLDAGERPIREIACDGLAELEPARARAELEAALEDEGARGVLLAGLDALPPALRPVLLERLRRPGAGLPRVVTTATPRLREAVQAGAFPRELFHAVGAHVLEVPPLCERKDDVPVLLHVTARAFADRAGVRARPFSTDVVRALRNYAWPGNLPELVAAVEGALASAENPVLTRVDFPFLPRRAPDVARPGAIVPLAEIKKDAAIAIERAYVDALLEHAGGNVSLAAHLASMDRANFRRTSKHGALAKLRHPAALAELLREAARVVRRAADDGDER